MVGLWPTATVKLTEGINGGCRRGLQHMVRWLCPTQGWRTVSQVRYTMVKHATRPEGA